VNRDKLKTIGMVVLALNLGWVAIPYGWRECQLIDIQNRKNAVLAKNAQMAKENARKAEEATNAWHLKQAEEWQRTVEEYRASHSDAKGDQMFDPQERIVNRPRLNANDQRLSDYR
jgi:hypothetical protein